MNHEMKLTLFPDEALGSERGYGEGTDTVSPSWRGAIPAPQAAHPPGREPKPSVGHSVAQGKDQLLTVEEFADELRVTRACVRKWILTRKVSVVKIGRLVRLKSSELRRLIEEGSRPRAESR